MKKLYFLLIAACLTLTPAQASVNKMAAARHATSSAPTTLPATNVTAEGFTANWKAFPGASCYQVTVFEPITVAEADTYCVLEESFDLVGIGTFAEPEFLDDWVVDFSEYDFTFTPDWSGYLPVFARGMVGGIVYSPYIDLTNNDGKYTVELDIVGYAGSKITLKSIGTKEENAEFTCTATGLNRAVFNFTNGCHDTFLCYVDCGIPNDDDNLYSDCYAFIDNFAVYQDLKAGDTVLRLVSVHETEEDSGDTSHSFAKLPYRDGASHLAYDVMAINVIYNDPDDPWDYDIEYSDYSPLEHVFLVGAGIENVATEAQAPAQYFNLQGQPVADPSAPGIYIRRQGNSTTKIIR